MNSDNNSLTNSIIELALQEDLGQRGDISSNFFIPETANACGKIIARENCIISGSEIAALVFNKVNSEIKILPSESKRTQFKTSKQTLLIEESDAEESLGNDNQPIILAQASINQNNNWEFTESEHYMRLVPTQPTIGGPDKIEVAEFFYYGCIHCMTFEPIINAWKKDIPESARFVRVPALWNPLLSLHGRM